MNIKSSIIIGLSILLGLFCISNSLNNQYSNASESDRIVSVKGFAEKEVLADQVLWPITYTVYSNDLKKAAEKLENDSSIILSFLKKSGINDSEIIITQPNVEYKTYNSNLMARNSESALLGSSAVMDSPKMVGTSNASQQKPASGTNDKDIKDKADEKEKKIYFTISKSVVVNSKQVDVVLKLISSIGSLVHDGVSLSDQYNYSQIEYKFTKLDEIKPQMIEDATKNARSLAEKFAQDSNSTLGKVKKASQGQFSVRSEAHYTPQVKNVRVENYVEYYLVD